MKHANTYTRMLTNVPTDMCKHARTHPQHTQSLQQLCETQLLPPSETALGCSMQACSTALGSQAQVQMLQQS